ncbi:MAG: hydrogenase maturation nickel metallochaperone HypA [Anaerolineae bacterium]|nr:MAG: hydrogenase maturation nickel metallochaperone HypA [Anaerolineae bacterium]
MHELSIAQNLVEIANTAAQQANVQRVTAVRLQLGVLSGVVKDSLLFCYDIANAGTLLEGSKLLIEELPVIIYCPQCQQTVALETVQAFRCPVCGTFSSDIRQGRELEILSLEAEEEENEYPSHP